jgi:PAS domain S-box-containing protein
MLEINALGLRVADHVHAMLAYWDKELVCRFANNAYLSWFGKTRADMVDIMTLGQLWEDRYHEIEPFVTGVLNGQHQQFENEIVTPSGEVRQAMANYYPDIVDGAVAGFFVHGVDITAIKTQQNRPSRSEKRFSVFLNATPDPLVILNQYGKIEFVNARTEAMFGYDRQQLQGKTFEILLAEKTRAEGHKRWAAIFAARKAEAVFAVELNGVNSEGEEFPAEVMISRIVLADGLYYSAAIRDITERRKHEKALGELAAIVDSTCDAIISKLPDGTITTWNKGAERILGYTSEEALGRHISLMFPPDIIAEEEALVARIMNGETIAQYETIRLRKDGVRINVSITLAAIKDKKGDIVGISKILRDITQQKKAEQELKERNESNRIFVQQAPNALAMFDKDMRYLAASQRWLQDYNLKEIDIIGRSHYEIFPEISNEWKQIHQDCLKGNINTCDEEKFERKDGSVQWIEWDVRPWYISEGVIGGLLMYTADITEQKKKDEERKKTQYVLEKSNQIAGIASWEVDAATGVAVWGAMAYDIFEIPHDFKPNTANTPAFYKKGPKFDNLLAAIKAATEQGKPYDVEAEILTAKGKNRWIRIIGESEFKGGVCVRRFGIFQDITKAKEAEARLQRTKDELEAILNSSHVSIIGTDEQGIITHFNHGAELMLGYTAAEMIGQHSPLLIHLEKEVSERERELTAKFGRPVSGFDVFAEVARHGNADSREWTYLRKDGTSFPVQLVVTTAENKQGEIVGFIGVAADISELKKAQNEMKTLLDLTMEQNERLKNFAHIVSHNLRSHSGNIGVLLDFYIAEHPEAAKNEYIDMLKKSADSLKETIKHLTEVVSINVKTRDKFVPVNIFNCATSAISNVSQMARTAGATIHNSIAEDAIIMGLQAYADSVLLNFITNSIKYCATDRPPEVNLASSIQGKYVVITIQDNGLGIDLKENGSKLFGMYNTFHGNKDARGLGLFITKNQVEAMGGKIEVESQPNVGTTFRIYLIRA